MTPLKSPISRRTNNSLDGSFGRDKHRQLAITLIPGTDTVADLIELRPYGTRQRVTIAACDVYRLALRAEANRKTLEKARDKKARRQASRERQSLDRLAKKLKRPIQ